MCVLGKNTNYKNLEFVRNEKCVESVRYHSIQEVPVKKML